MAALEELRGRTTLEEKLQREANEKEQLQLAHQELSEALHARPTGTNWHPQSEAIEASEQLAENEKKQKELQTEMLKKEEKVLTEMVSLKGLMRAHHKFLSSNQPPVGRKRTIHQSCL